MSDLLRDVRHAARLLLRSPAFTCVAVVSLGLGMGGSTAVFSLVDALLLRPLPFPESSRLVRVYNTDAEGRSFGSVGYADYADYRDGSRALQALAAHRLADVSLGGGGGPSEVVQAELVTGNYFEVLRTGASRGRTLRPSDDLVPGGHPVTVLSHGLWQRRFGGDDVLGRTIRLNGYPFTVVGVMPPGFHGTVPALAVELWAPIMMQPQLMPRPFDLLRSREVGFLEVIGRLRPGVPAAQAAAEIGALAARIDRDHPWPEGQSRRIKVVPAAPLPAQMRGSGSVRTFLFVLMGAVTLVLLIAALNVANLLLVRAVGRRREVALRLSLGATRARLVRQLLTESVLIALAGAAAGVLVALWIGDLLEGLRPPGGPPLAIAVGLDMRVLAFTLLVGLGTGILFGLAPALQASRPDLLPALKDDAIPGGQRPSRLRRVLVAGQVAASLVLLIGAGLALRSLRNAAAMDPGFEVRNQLALSVDLRLRAYSEEAGRRFWAELQERVRALPGARATSLAALVPLGFASRGTPVAPEEKADDPAARVQSDFNAVSPGYFGTLGIPLLAGREFTESDGEDAPAVIIVNQTLAGRLWPGRDPLGRRVRIAGPPVTGPDGPRQRLGPVVVGVVRDGKYRTLGEEPRALLYFPAAQRYYPEMTLHVRTERDPAALAAAVRAQVQSLDPDLPIQSVRTLSQHLALALLPARLAGSALGVFGALGLAMAALGLYGVVSYSVGQRLREIGVRVALGARRADIIRLVLKEGMTLAGAGLVVGLLVSLAATRALQSLLYGLSPSDPTTFAAIAVLLVGVAALASYLPARRAAAVDPMVALRYE